MGDACVGDACVGDACVGDACVSDACVGDACVSVYLLPTLLVKVKANAVFNLRAHLPANVKRK